MQVIHLQCPNCGSTLQVEDGLETFFCQYCGHRIVLSGQSEHVVKAKVDIERLKHEERMRQMEIEKEKEEREAGERETKRFILLSVGFLLALVICGTIGKLLGWM